MKKLNNRSGRVFQILSLGLIFAGGVFLIHGQANKPVLISDGRTDASALQPTRAEEQLIEREVRKKESVIKEKSALDCDEDTFSVGNAADGSFTKPKAAQRAVLYELCRSGRSFGIGGIVIIENGQIVSHYTYGENGLDSGIKALPDINQNGLSELVLNGGGGGQGYTAVTVEIVEITPRGVQFFGNAQIYSDDYGTGKPKTSATAYKVSVQKGKTPIYFRETYTQKSAPGNWTLTKKSHKFSLTKDYTPKFNKIP